MKSQQREAWLEADRQALQVILAAGNRLVPITVPRNRGVPIARTVTARRIKVDQSTGSIEKFKSRHSFDGGFYHVQVSQLSKMTGRPPTE
jgi:hypothetical protein